MSTMFILPLVIALLFVLVEIGFNMRYRMSVDNILHDTIRSVAMDGTAGCPPDWSSLATASGACNGSTRTWQTEGRRKLLGLCGNGAVRCTSTTPANLSMTCTPTQTNAIAAGGTKVAPEPGLTVRCTARFPYRNLVNFTVSNRTFNLGFGTLWSEPIVVTAESTTMIGSGE